MGKKPRTDTPAGRTNRQTYKTKPYILALRDVANNNIAKIICEQAVWPPLVADPLTAIALNRLIVFARWRQCARLSNRRSLDPYHSPSSHSVTCQLVEVKFPPLPQPVNAGTRFSDPGEMQG